MHSSDQADSATAAGEVWPGAATAADEVWPGAATAAGEVAGYMLEGFHLYPAFSCSSADISIRFFRKRQGNPLYLPSQLPVLPFSSFPYPPQTPVTPFAAFCLYKEPPNAFFAALCGSCEVLSIT